MLVLVTSHHTLYFKARAFPHATMMLQQEASSHFSGEGGSTLSPVPLNSFPQHQQQFLLMRDLLSVLAGVEGQYIRIAAAKAEIDGAGSVRRGSSQQHPSMPVVSAASFVIDLDSSDRSAASQVCCKSYLFVRFAVSNLFIVIFILLPFSPIRRHSCCLFAKVQLTCANLFEFTVDMSTGWCRMPYVPRCARSFASLMFLLRNWKCLSMKISCRCKKWYTYCSLQKPLFVSLKGCAAVSKIPLAEKCLTFCIKLCLNKATPNLVIYIFIY
jgi:hypothetical protein